MTYEEWLPGWLARQAARRKRLKQMIVEVLLRKLAALGKSGSEVTK